MSSYLHLAKSDLKYANYGLRDCDDEIDINYAAYHIHQAIEKTIKACLELNGIDLTDRTYKTHDISFLISKLPVSTDVPEVIIKNLYKINRWVSEPRYNINFRQSKRELDEVYEATFTWLNQILDNGVRPL